MKSKYRDAGGFLGVAKFVGVGIVLIVLIVVLNLTIYCLYGQIRQDLYAGSASHLPEISILRAMAIPLGTLLIIVFCLGLEAWNLGYEKSSIRRLLQFRNDRSSFEDLFYLYLGISSATKVFAFFMSLGVGYWIHWNIVHHLKMDLVAGKPYWIQIGVMLFVGPFIFYWHHRLMHWRMLWNVHKVHHAAVELNIVTPLRNHPIDRAIDEPLKAAPAAVLGVSPEVVLGYTIMNGFYQCLVHSDWDWGRGWFGRYLLINPSRHRLHHATAERYWNVNFGIFPIWDRLFGTFRDLEIGEDPAEIAIGLSDDPEHNQARPLKLMFVIYFHFLVECGRFITTPFRRGLRPSKKTLTAIPTAGSNFLDVNSHRGADPLHPRASQALDSVHEGQRTLGHEGPIAPAT